MGAAGSGYHRCWSRRADLGRPEPRLSLGDNEHEVACRPQQSIPHYRTQWRRPARPRARGKFDLTPRALSAFEPTSERLLERRNETRVHFNELLLRPFTVTLVVRVKQGIERRELHGVCRRAEAGPINPHYPGASSSAMRSRAAASFSSSSATRACSCPIMACARDYFFTSFCSI